MNVRLSAGELRFRVTADEYQVLKEGKKLTERIDLPGGKAIGFGIVNIAEQDGAPVQGMKVELSNGDLLLLVSEEALRGLNPENPSKEGVSARVEFDPDLSVKCSLQIDIKGG